jgi:ribosome-binding ATPase YchF (GTP1/OBG family)
MKRNIKGRQSTISRPEQILESDRNLIQLKREIQRKANIAHKRLERLERNNLTQLPAYQQWVKDGEVRFGVRGKTYNELQAELARLNRFLDSKTSTVREANKHLKDIAQMTGVKYKSVKELPNKLENFFRISEKIEEYLRNIEDSASAIGYHKIWEVVNEVVEKEGMDLEGSERDIESIIQEAIDALEYEHIIEITNPEDWNWTIIP